MAWDLGTLKQSLILDIENFVAGIKTAIQNVDTLEARMKSLQGLGSTPTVKTPTLETLDIDQHAELMEQAGENVRKVARETTDSLDSMWQANIRSQGKAEAEIVEQHQRAAEQKLKQEQAYANEVKKNFTRMHDEQTKLDRQLDKDRGSRIGEINKKEKAAAAEYSRALIDLAKANETYHKSSNDQINEALEYRKFVNKRATAEMAGGWRLYAHESTNSIRKFFAESTKNFRPVELIWHCAFNDRLSARRFEAYLKTGSGQAFRNKHLV